MATVQFATCDRRSALKYLQTVYPNHTITDTPDSAGPLLDFVEKDLVRVQDPMMYGMRIGIVPGEKWIEDAETRKKILAACKVFTDLS